MEALVAPEPENRQHHSTVMDTASLERPETLDKESPGCDRQGALNPPGDREKTRIQHVVIASQNEVMRKSYPQNEVLAM